MGDERTDREAIIGMTAAYCSALDADRYEQLRNVFTPEATADLGGEGQVGVDQIIERVSAALAPFESCRHRVHSHEIEITGDTATARCSVLALHMRPEGAASPVYTVEGTYADRLLRTDAGWRITHRDLIVVSRDG